VILRFNPTNEMIVQRLEIALKIILNVNQMNIDLYQKTSLR